jgi:hypothetical protein
VFAPCITPPVCTAVPPSRGFAWTPGSQSSGRPTKVPQPRQDLSPLRRCYCHQDTGRPSPKRYEKRYETIF